MKRKDYTTLISHYIPNEATYHFIFPLAILDNYNGPDNLDITLDDNLLYFIIEPLLNNRIQYNYEIIRNVGNTDKMNDSIDICVKLNGKEFDPKIVIDNLVKNKMSAGLAIFKEEYGNLNKVF